MQAEAQAIFNKFNAISGNYELTVMQGVWHAFCDSGIMTDAFSIRDAKRVNAAKIDLDKVFALDDINALVKDKDNGEDLDCVQCVNAIKTMCKNVKEFFANVSI